MIEKKEFIQYLYESSDFDTLYTLGVTNKRGEKESRRVLYTQVDDKLWENYNQTKNERYIDFDCVYMKYVKTKTAFFVSVCITSLIFVIIIESF
jgi:hypothetical protein